MDISRQNVFSITVAKHFITKSCETKYFFRSLAHLIILKVRDNTKWNSFERAKFWNQLLVVFFFNTDMVEKWRPWITRHIFAERVLFPQFTWKQNFPNIVIVPYILLSYRSYPHSKIFENRLILAFMWISSRLFFKIGSKKK